MSKIAYHHGDLRNALLISATEMLATEGVHNLSLRKVAQHLGVSHNAPYQHFADKEALIAAIAEQGFQRLGETIQITIAQTHEQTVTARLAAAGRAYVQFMTQKPHYLAVMFGRFEHENYPILAQAAHQTLALLVGIIEDGQHEGVFKPGNSAQIAGVIWIVVHGLSAIFIAQKLPHSILQEHTADTLTTLFVEMIYQGIGINNISTG